MENVRESTLSLFFYFDNFDVDVLIPFIQHTYQRHYNGKHLNDNLSIRTPFLSQVWNLFMSLLRCPFINTTTNSKSHTLRKDPIIIRTLFVIFVKEDLSSFKLSYLKAVLTDDNPSFLRLKFVKTLFDLFSFVNSKCQPVTIN